CKCESTGMAENLLVSRNRFYTGWEILTCSWELVASFPECNPCAPWPSWRRRAGGKGDAVRKMRSTPRQCPGWHARDHCMFCSCTPEIGESYGHAFSSYISRGCAD